MAAVRPAVLDGPGSQSPATIYASECQKPYVNLDRERDRKTIKIAAAAGRDQTSQKDEGAPQSRRTVMVRTNCDTTRVHGINVRVRMIGRATP